MPPSPTGGVNEAAIADQNRQAQQGQTDTAPVSAPDPRQLSEGARDLRDLQQDLTRDMGRVYQDPEKAYQNLTQLDDAGRERLRQDPSLIGEVREGVQPDRRTMDSYVAASESYGQSSDSSRREVASFNEQARAHEAQTRAGQGQDRSLAGQMNGTLTAAPTLTHNLSI